MEETVQEEKKEPDPYANVEELSVFQSEFGVVPNLN